MRRLPLAAALFLLLTACAGQSMRPTEVKTVDPLPARSSSTTSAVEIPLPMLQAAAVEAWIVGQTPAIQPLPPPPPRPRLVAPRPPPKLSQPSRAPAACSGWLAEVTAAFGTQTGKACHVLACESGGNPQARNASGASGLFQIVMPLHAGLFLAHGWPTSSVFDGVRNITIAAEIERAEGWGPWACR